MSYVFLIPTSHVIQFNWCRYSSYLKSANVLKNLFLHCPQSIIIYCIYSLNAVVVCWFKKNGGGLQKWITAPYFTVYLDTNHRILCVKCQIHSMPILMHHMRISSTYVSSVMLSPNDLEIRKVLTVKSLPKMPWNGAKYVEL